MLKDLEILPEWREVCKRYRYDIKRFAIEALGMRPTLQQEQLFASVAVSGSRTSVASGHGCFGIDTPVMLYDGTVKPVQEIMLDDVLMGDDGTPRNVLELYRGQENMYRFTYNDGSSHIFNESHILCLVATNTKGTRKTGDKITVTVREWLNWSISKKRCWAIYRNSVEHFGKEIENLPIDPYILGTWLGDGSSAKTEITTADFEIKQAWESYANELGCRFVERGQCGKAKTYAISKSSSSNYSKNPFYHALVDLGVWKNKHIPQIYLTADYDSRCQLLAGLIDTDGSLDGCGYDFIQKNKIIAEQVVFLAKSIGCHATIKEVQKTCTNNGVVGTYWRVTIGRNIDLIPVRIERKKRPNLEHQRRKLNFGIKSVEPLGLGNYYGFELDGNHLFLGGDFTVLHNTGKTRSAGVIALWHLLFFPHSVLMFTAPQIDQLRKLVFKEIAICVSALKSRKLAWLADYVVLLAESVYIKGHQKTWHVIAKTAPKHSPTNLAGQHGDNYMVWVDEACGVDDGVMEVVMGALTHKDNRAVMTSQPARPTGFFYDTHHKLAKRNGGVWNALTFNGEESEIVSDEVIREQLLRYGSREDAGYMIRIRGLFPDMGNEFLITHSQARKIFKGRSIGAKTHKGYGYVASVDVGGGVKRDYSVITIARVWGYDDFGEYAKRVDIVDIPFHRNNDDFYEIAGCLKEQIRKYPNLSIILDTTGAGTGLKQHLEREGISFNDVNWGVPCFREVDKQIYGNAKAQAFVCLQRAVKSGHFKVLTPLFRTKIEEQITRLPYSFDEKGRYFISSKDDMKRQGISSPDIVDTFAFLFLRKVSPIPAKSEVMTMGVRSKQQDLDELADLVS